MFLILEREYTVAIEGWFKDMVDMTHSGKTYLEETVMITELNECCWKHTQPIWKWFHTPSVGELMPTSNVIDIHISNTYQSGGSCVTVGVLLFTTPSPLPPVPDPPEAYRGTATFYELKRFDKSLVANRMASNNWRYRVAGDGWQCLYRQDYSSPESYTPATHQQGEDMSVVNFYSMLGPRPCDYHVYVSGINYRLSLWHSSCSKMILWGLK